MTRPDSPEADQLNSRPEEGLNALLPMYAPPVLYGLLTADDVRRLERRRERFARLLWAAANAADDTDPTPQGAD